MTRTQPGRHHTVDPEQVELVAGCLAGLPEAWNGLVCRFRPLACAVARRHGLAEADAEDVAQEVLLVLLRKLHTVRDAGRLAGWMRRVAVRESSREARRRRLGPFAGDGIPARDPPVEVLAIGDETRHLVKQAIETLSERSQRLIVSLFGHAPSGYETIGPQLNLKRNSIGPARTRCIRELRRVLMPRYVRHDLPMGAVSLDRHRRRDASSR